jgi:type IV secretory pathway VirB2 component (pilin)
MKKWVRSKLAGVALAVLVAGGALPARAAGDGTASQALLGTSAALCSLVYGPLKIGYAVVGTTISGLAWVFTGGSSDVAAPIFYASLRGDYVVTPEHLTLERPLEFVGRDPEAF